MCLGRSAARCTSGGEDSGNCAGSTRPCDLECGPEAEPLPARVPTGASAPCHEPHAGVHSAEERLRRDALAEAHLYDV